MLNLSENWKKEMELKLDYNYVMKEYVGDVGINKDDIAKLEDQIKKSYKEIERKKNEGLLGFMELPYQKEVVEQIEKTANNVRKNFENFVVIGIGGSALGNIALQEALNGKYFNQLTKEERNGAPRFFVIDNVDPESLDRLLNVLDPHDTMFNVITKSGSTAETMGNFTLVYEWLIEKLGRESAKDHVIATTDEEKGTLLQIANKEGFETFIIPANVGGRFSVFSPVGLLSAAICGINIEELLAGAAHMDERCKTEDIYKNPAYIDALIHYIFMEKGLNISVMMPYSDSLKYLSDWYGQLWAESLGKRVNNDGEEVNTGQTPVKALGTIDQHSQVQLYTEGPTDKITTFIRVEKFRKTVNIPNTFKEYSSIEYLGGHTLNELMNVEERATEIALLKFGKPNCTIVFPEINPFTVGQFIYMQELKTAFAGELLNIDAFNQPGVEEGKNATYGLIGRTGYEEKKKEIEKLLAKKGQEFTC